MDRTRVENSKPPSIPGRPLTSHVLNKICMNAYVLFVPGPVEHIVFPTFLNQPHCLPGDIWVNPAVWWGKERLRDRVWALEEETQKGMSNDKYTTHVGSIYSAGFVLQFFKVAAGGYFAFFWDDFCRFEFQSFYINISFCSSRCPHVCAKLPAIAKRVDRHPCAIPLKGKQPQVVWV